MTRFCYTESNGGIFVGIASTEPEIQSCKAADASYNYVQNLFLVSTFIFKI